MNVRQYPKQAEAFSTLGWVYYKNGSLNEAERVIADRPSPLAN